MDLAPIEYVIIEFPSEAPDPEVAPAIADLVDTGLVRILDLVFVRKDPQGTVTWFEFDERDDLAAFGAIEGEVDGVMGDDDIVEIADDLPLDCSALLIVWEDLWAADLGRAIRRAGGRIAGGERIPHEVVVAAIGNDDD